MITAREWMAKSDGWEDEDFHAMRMSAIEEGMLLSKEHGLWTFVEKE